nr:Formate acetyltransferase 1 [Klebsiella pneumoniae]
MQVGPKSEPIKGDVLNFDEVMDRMDHFMDWLAKQYVTALNIIHYMHDKYSYEASLMALHDRDVIRTMACGIAGLSVAADSCLLSNMRKLNRFVTKTVWLSTSKSKANTRSLVTTTLASMTWPLTRLNVS